MSDRAISSPMRLDLPDGKVLGKVFSVTFVALLAVALFQLLDPFVRHDDFPALLADPSGFAEKTLSEGRWLPYFWHMRPWVWSAAVNFWIYTGLWSLFCAAFALSTLNRDGQIWDKMVLSLLIALAPPATMISTWFNTGIPNVAVIAIYALLSVWLSDRTMRWLLYLFIPLAITSYTTNALLILLVCVARDRSSRSLRDLAMIVTHFVLAFALGICVVYSINYFVYGVFGIEVSEWRSPNPAIDLASAIANIPLALEVQAKFIFENSLSSIHFLIVHAGLFLFGLLFLFRQNKWRTLYILTGFLVCVGILTLQVVKTGVDTPARASMYIWVSYAVILVSLIPLARQRSNYWLSLLRIFLIVMILTHAQTAFRFYSDFPEWQDETRSLAKSVPNGSGPVHIIGDYMSIPGAEDAGIQSGWGIRLRLQYLTGERFILCGEETERCEKDLAGDTQKRVMVLTSDPEAHFP